jgi:hypothetical protein
MDKELRASTMDISNNEAHESNLHSLLKVGAIQMRWEKWVRSEDLISPLLKERRMNHDGS